MRIKLESSQLEYLPTLQTKKNTQGINTSKTIMDYTTDPRNIEEQTNRSAAAAAAAGQASINRQATNSGQNPDNRIPYQTYNSQSQSQSQSLPLGSNQEQQSIQQMASTAAPNYRPAEYHPRVPQQQQQQQQQQQAPQHAAYQQYGPPSQGYLQQPPNQMAASHYPPTQLDYAAQGFPQQQGHLQAPPQAPYQQTAYSIQEPPTMQTHSHIAMQTSYTQRTGARSILERPVIKLSVNLIDTYKRINEAYYDRKREAVAAENAEKRNEPRGQGVHNHGWDDEHYDYILRSGEILEGRYRLSERIGKGSFGQVVRAFDIETNKDVAIKIIKSRRPFLLQARTEIDLLTHLKTQDPSDQNNIGKSSQVKSSQVLDGNYLIHSLTQYSI
jgi:hypothetical protein